VTKAAFRSGLDGQLLTGEERRRSQRVILRVPVTLQFAVSGKTVTAPAHTVSVNDHGAMLQCTRTFAAEATLELRNDRTGDKLPCRVTRAPIENTAGYLIPIEFSTPSPTFWRISFPPRDWKPGDE
jgi:hypothetical protein